MQLPLQHFSIKKCLLATAITTVFLAGCGSSGSGDGAPPPSGDWPKADVTLSDWQTNLGEVSRVASAKLAGSYALADTQQLDIEIRDIRQTLQHKISGSDIVALLPDMALNHEHALCAMTFTPSGRFLYLAVCDGESGDDAILAYNTNTETLSVFDRLSLGDGKLGMHYYKSQLYVGAQDGVYRIEADRNAVYAQNDNVSKTRIALPEQVVDIALDTEAETFYFATESGIYRHRVGTNNASRVYSATGIEGVAFSRIYGQQSAAGLYIAQAVEGNTGLSHVAVDKLRQNGNLTPQRYSLAEGEWQSFSLTADGSLLFSDGAPYQMRENGDQRLGFEAWMAQELSHYVKAIKGLIASDITGNSDAPEGFLIRKLQNNNPNTLPIADNVGWAMYLLMIADQVNPDPEIEPLIELLMQRHAGLHPDGLGGVKSVDGHFVRNYEGGGSGMPNLSSPQMQVYISMKFLPAAYKAAEMYPDNANIQQYLSYLQQVIQRSGDVVRAEQRITWESDDFGPKRMNHLMTNETWLFGELAAAQDPNATSNYANFTYHREDFRYDDYLNGEPVIRADNAAFIVMGAPLILDHHFSDSGWSTMSHNYYALTQSVTDDEGFPYLAAFSAGNNPFNPDSNGNYYNDGPSDHPGNFIHFPAVLGFGQLGKLDAVVGGYHAYRDGRRQLMQSNGYKDIEMLSRWSMDHPEYEIDGIGIADFWFGGVGLAESIQPGVTQQFRNAFYLPDVMVAQNTQGHQVVTFSAITPRLVTGIRADGERDVFGYQLSPYTLPTDTQFSEFEISDPTDEWVWLDDVVGLLENGSGRFENPNFITDTRGWVESDVEVSMVSGLKGQAARLSPNGAEGSLHQAVKLDVDADGTEFIVGGYVRPESAGAGYLRVSWSANGQRGPETLSRHFQSSDTAVSDYHDRVGEGRYLSVRTQKPAGKDYLHIEYVVEGDTSTRVVVDNTSLQRIGASQHVVNGDFESGESHWQLSGGAMITSAVDEVIEGMQSLKMTTSGGESQAEARYDFDIADDPDGTRYIFKMRVGDRALAGAKFAVHFIYGEDTYHHTCRTGNSFQDWCDVTFIDDQSPDEITFTMRKRPGESRFRLWLLMDQLSGDIAPQYVVLDDVRLYKQQLFDINHCDGGITGC
ncbi:hypothetical protein [Thaumasiovibrio subtropicus]|uniref:hypothetical protein n=1 Tax=Thaumasiovibrio subtropicus TaxID=1891207 RepID=UPI000B36341B|nr:hypothetical protein [Thaumasiovibrio subtropicus]